MSALILNSGGEKKKSQAATSCVQPFDSQVCERKHRCNITLQLKQLYQITLTLCSGACLCKAMHSFSTCDCKYRVRSQACCCNHRAITVLHATAEGKQTRKYMRSKTKSLNEKQQNKSPSLSFIQKAL